MTARTLTVNLRNLDESAVVGAVVTLRLMEVDHTGSATLVVSSDEETTDASGDCTFSNVIPNTDGTQGRLYNITAHNGSGEVLNEDFQMPDANSSLHDLVGAATADPARSAWLDATQVWTGGNTFTTIAVSTSMVLATGATVTGIADEDDMVSDSAALLATQQSIKAYSDSGTQTLTNKSTDLANNTLTGTLAEFNTALSDGDFASLAGSETLTNKTLTAPTLGGTTTIDQDSNATALSIDTEATTTYGVNVSATELTTGAAIRAADLNSLTSGYGLLIVSDSPDTNTRYLGEFRNDNVLATGAMALFARQDSANNAIYVSKTGNGAQSAHFQNTGTGVNVLINQDSDAQALRIDTEATSADGIHFPLPAQTSGNAIAVKNADSLTTGRGLLIESNSADTSSRNLLTVINDNALATGAIPLLLQQDSNNYGLNLNKNGTGSGNAFQLQNSGTGAGLYIDQNGNGVALNIDSESTTESVVKIDSATITSANGLQMTSYDALTGGKMLWLHSNSADTNTRYILYAHNDNSLAVGAVPAIFIQDAANAVMALDQNATAAGSSFIDFQGTAAANSTGPVSTLTTSGATTHHIQIEINGTKAWIPVSTTNPS